MYLHANLAILPGSKRANEMLMTEKNYVYFNCSKLLCIYYIRCDVTNDDTKIYCLSGAPTRDKPTYNCQWEKTLLSSFTGSPRHMHEKTKDTMTYVRNYGRADLFVTFTCNPEWEEIK